MAIRTASLNFILVESGHRVLGVIHNMELRHYSRDALLLLDPHLFGSDPFRDA
jgi:hypothetical protein